MSTFQYTFDRQDWEHIRAKLLYVSSSVYGADWHSTLHSHYFSEFFYVIKGKGKFVVDDIAFDVCENDLAIVNPDVRHTEVSEYNSEFAYVAIGISDISFRFPSSQMSDKYSLFHFDDQKEEMQGYLRTLVREAEQKQPRYRVVCQNLVETIMIKMMRKEEFEMTFTASKQSNFSCAAAKRYIDLHFKEAITLEDLAKLSHVNKYYFAHSFSKDYGMSPIQYLINTRIEESKKLLATTDYSIAQISMVLGFSSQSYFSQAFKRICGISPAQYRGTMRVKKV